jgi:hypothetical protein
VLKLAKMEEHVWTAHRLVAYRGAWRPGWEAIAGCLDEFVQAGDERYLRQALELARHDDPQTGEERLARLARQKGLRHPLLPEMPWAGEGLRTVLWVAAMLLAVALVLWLLFR